MMLLRRIAKLDTKTKGPILDGIASAYYLTDDIQDKVFIRKLWRILIKL